MRVYITHPIGDYHAGVIYDVPDKKARELIEHDMAFEIKEEQVFETLPDFDADILRTSKPKRKVNYGDR
jgi:hypothetical protein